MIEIRVHLIATNGFPSHNFNSQAFLGNGQSRVHDFAEKAPLDLKLLSMTVQNELQTSKQTGELFFGFLLH